MSSANFKYDAHIQINQSKPKIEIKSVQFLVPIRIEALVNGTKEIINGQIDYVKKQAYFDSYNSSYNTELNDKIWGFLTQITDVPEDIFEAPSEVYNEANRAQEEHDSLREENV